MPKVVIEESFQFKNIDFELVAIIYFQKMHYTLHLKGVSYPLFLSNRHHNRLYHDDMKNILHNGTWEKGLLFENYLKFEFHN